MADLDELGSIRWTSESRLGGKLNNCKFYESFIYDGEEYDLFDSVYIYTKDDDDEPEIGKLLKAWETSKGKFARILWFFRPRDISNYLRGKTHLKNELFLASGEGKGLINNCPLEAIAGKCNVICTSKDKRNPQPSEEQISSADYVFHRTFDVGRCEILEQMDDSISGVHVKFLLNRVGREAPLVISKPDLKGKEHKPSSGYISNGKRPLSPTTSSIVERAKIPKDSQKIEDGLKRRKIDAEPSRLASGKLPKSSQARLPDDYKRIDNQVSERPVVDKRKWFNPRPWEEELKDGYVDGSLVLLLNLNPAYTSVEVQELIKDSFSETCLAKMVQRTAFSSPYSGQAFVKFLSKEVAERVISKLNQCCLVLPGGRSVAGRIITSAFIGKQSVFYGHLSIDKLRHQMQRDKKIAVSTSHCSQPNTIEYEMALEWCLLQSRMQRTCESMHKQHGEDLKRLKDRLKSTLKTK